MRLSLSDVLAATGGTLEGPSAPVTFGAVSTDTREIGEGSLFLALKGERFDGHDFVEEALRRGAAGVVLSAGPAPGSVPAVRVADTLLALGALGRFVRRRLGLRVIAVTGSVGKTTTKEMIGALLRAEGLRVLQTPGNLNNRIGLPLTLLSAVGDEETAVLELGVSEPGEMAHLTRICEPDVAVITAVAACHTERLGSVEGVAREKLSIAQGLREGGTLVLPFGEPLLVAPAGVRAARFGWEPGAELRGEGLELHGNDGSSFRLGSVELDLPLPGRHNAENALAALAAVRACGFSAERAPEALASLRPSPLRGEVRAGVHGARLYVDCYNANPRAMEAALETVATLAGSSRRVAVLGEMKELGELCREGHARVGRVAARLGYDELHLLGESCRWVGEAAVEAGLAPGKARVYGGKEELSEALPGRLGPGDWVLIKGSRAMGLEAVAERLSTPDQRTT
ncbi:MAG: UDP-N-acetylmuramoyl-tripeptide--D-alanyl-D-alanine ligase [Deltaproteobacteria bacterium]|nr:UDP-N-acetylmuramoyl-tripeptide--D-alanyl-D-alanine ligase [Deltaproteobacteria bacterium]